MLMGCCWTNDGTPRCYKKAPQQAPQIPQQPQPQPQQQQQQPQGRPYFVDTTVPPYQTPYPGAPNPYQQQQQQPQYQQPPPYGQCNEIVVQDPQVIKTCNGNYYGSQCKFTCRAGWRMYMGTGTETRTCQSNGYWSGKTPSCSNPPMNTGNPPFPFPPQQQRAPNNPYPQQYYPNNPQNNNNGYPQTNYGAQQPTYTQSRPSSGNVGKLFETLGITNPPPTFNNNNNNGGQTGGGALGTSVSAPSGGSNEKIGEFPICSVVASLEDPQVKKDWMKRHSCSGKEPKIDKDEANQYVKSLFGGLIDLDSTPKPPTGPVGSMIPKYGNNQIIPKHAPSSIAGQQQNQMICKLLKGQGGSAKTSSLLAAQYGCPLASSGNPLLSILQGNTPSLPSLLKLFGGEVKKKPEYKKGAIILDAVPYGTLKQCWDKADEYETCKYAANINVNRETDCFNIGCVYKRESGQCFSCPLIPASAYLLQQTTDTCDVISADREECPDFKNFQLSTIMFASQNPSPSSSSSSSSPDISSYLGGKGLSQLTKLFEGGSSSSNTNSALNLFGGGGLNPSLLSMFSRSSSNSAPANNNPPPPPPQRSNEPGESSDFGRRVAQESPGVRSMDISSLLPLLAGGGGSSGLAGLLGGGGGGAAGLAGLLGGGGGGAAGLAGLLGGGLGGSMGGAFGGMDPKLLSALLSKGSSKPSSSSDLIALMYGGSGISSETKKVLADGCKKKQCCWKPGGTLGGTCYSKGNNFAKNCIPEHDSGDCGTSPLNTFARIIGGFDITSNTHRPWAVVIKAAGSSKLRCGGTLICSEWVLTSAACLLRIKSIEHDSLYVPNIDAQSLNIWIGTTDPVNPADTGTNVDVIEIIPHPQYTGKIHNDIALIQIKQQIFTDEKKPACLPLLSERSPAVGNILRFAGYGDSGNGLGYSTILKELDMTVTSFTSCDQKFSNQLPDAGVFCASSATDTDTCIGDSGSGAMRYDAENDIFKLVGVNIAGSITCDSSKPSVFTKVADYMPWIAQTTNACCGSFGGRVA
ncbi:uncharacterized protein LOC120342169 [Styela clava]